MSTANKLMALYEQAKAGLGGGGTVSELCSYEIHMLTLVQRRTTFHLDGHHSRSASKGGSLGMPTGASLDAFDDRFILLRSVLERKISVALELLVTVSGLLQSNDYVHLGPILWYQHLDSTDSHIIAPVCLCSLGHRATSNLLFFRADMFPCHAMC